MIKLYFLYVVKICHQRKFRYKKLYESNNITANNLLNMYQTKGKIVRREFFNMKATGIVRRIDDLGRVVIPKEIRRTLRIREGDPLEIYTATDGEVIFKKYSPVGELAEFASQYADVLAKISSMPTIITDRDHVIAAAGVSKREFLERRVTTVLEGYMENRKTYSATQQTLGDIQPIEGIEHYASVIYPIIAAGDVSGAVVMLTGEQTKIPTNAEIKLAQTAAAFLGKQMEE